MRTVDMPWHTSRGVTKVPSKQFAVTGRLRQHRRLAKGEAAYLQRLTSAPVKVTLIAPGSLVDRFWKDGETDRYYSSREELAAEVAGVSRPEGVSLGMHVCRGNQSSMWLGEHGLGTGSLTVAG